jgi:hypothetical protein
MWTSSDPDFGIPNGIYVLNFQLKGLSSSQSVVTKE